MQTVTSIGATVLFVAAVIYWLNERARTRKKHPASWTSGATSDAASGSWSFFSSHDSSSHDTSGSCGFGDTGGDCGGGH
jgi:4-amino-4-deoxy-L-arabinose transferase-like glycosyltransferase